VPPPAGERGYRARSARVTHHSDGAGALSERLPEAVAVAAYELMTGPLLAEPYRVGKRKLGGPPDLAERVRDMGFRELPVTHTHAIAAGRLPVHHRDPFDRILVAQATVEGLTLVTRDVDIQRYDVELLRPVATPAPHSSRETVRVRS
jgi:PIN domain nuclease of toxin-antitoxin system